MGFLFTVAQCERQIKDYDVMIGKETNEAYKRILIESKLNWVAKKEMIVNRLNERGANHE